MARKTKLEQAIDKLTPEDVIALQHIYLYRTLTVTQLMTSVYKLRSSQTRKRNAILRRLLGLGVVELEDYKENEHAVNLTTTGVNLVRQTKEIPQEIFDEKTRKIKRGYYTAGDLKMKRNLLNHQLTKNGFMLKFQRLVSTPKFKQHMKDLGVQFSYQYFDEKYLTSYVLMRPDSVLHVGDTDFFIEEDMATESAKQLRDKWHHYREFFQTTEFAMKKNKIAVLFLTDNIVKKPNLERRKELVRMTAMDEIGDTYKNYYNMYVGSQDEMLQMMPWLIENAYHVNPERDHLLQSLRQKNWLITPLDVTKSMSNETVKSIKKQLNHEDYWAYMAKMDKYGNLLSDNGRTCEFVLDDYTKRPLDVEHRMLMFDVDEHMFSTKFDRQLQYIVVLPNDYHEFIMHDLKQAKCVFSTNMFFTTFKLLESQPLHSALFKFDMSGKRYNFTDNSLSVRQYI